MADYKVTGGCLCGGIKYEITQPPSQPHYCHCTMCRKAIGADFGTDGGVRKEHFKFIKQDTLKEYNSSEDTTRCFCGVCGCSILVKAREGGKYEALNSVFLFLGSLDEDPQSPPGFHIYVKDKAPWVNINDDLPKCDGIELVNFGEFMQ